ncbi:hypothetical protein CAEBREN_20262 [Caenorhabditis brenneri]|uniref:L-Fucosyltransferase n=1 Tax=Caenorhabditis brenneri TaxID=135651 RepID=G0ML77_CAEBE|nr:hypothetical protein CAEBREN_20262 [Caenorhabditis brenneri]
MNVYSVFVFAVLAISSVSGIINLGGGKKCGGNGGYGNGGYGSGIVIGSSRNIIYISKRHEKRVEEDSHSKYIYSNLAVSKHLGNNIFELASLLGISRVLHRIPVIFVYNQTYNEMLNRVNNSIPGLLDQYLFLNESIPRDVKSLDFNIKCCIFENPNKLLSINDRFLHLTGLYYQSFKYFSGMQNELKSYLRKIPEQSFRLPSSSSKNHISCIHIRRGDFFKVGFHVADERFIRKTIKLIRRKETHPGQQITFVLFGDDLPFLKHLQKTADKDQKTNYFVSKNSVTEDLVYAMNNCDSVFISGEF